MCSSFIIIQRPVVYTDLARNLSYDVILVGVTASANSLFSSQSTAQRLCQYSTVNERLKTLW